MGSPMGDVSGLWEYGESFCAFDPCIYRGIAVK